MLSNRKRDRRSPRDGAPPQRAFSARETPRAGPRHPISSAGSSPGGSSAGGAGAPSLTQAAGLPPPRTPPPPPPRGNWFFPRNLNARLFPPAPLGRQGIFPRSARPPAPKSPKSQIKTPAPFRYFPPRGQDGVSTKPHPCTRRSSSSS